MSASGGVASNVGAPVGLASGGKHIRSTNVGSSVARVSTAFCGADSGASAAAGDSPCLRGSAAGRDAKNSDFRISTLSNPSDRKIDAKCSPEHPVSEVICSLATNPFDARWLGWLASRAAHALKERRADQSNT